MIADEGLSSGVATSPRSLSCPSTRPRRTLRTERDNKLGRKQRVDRKRRRGNSKKGRIVGVSSGLYRGGRFV